MQRALRAGFFRRGLRIWTSVSLAFVVQATATAAAHAQAQSRQLVVRGTIVDAATGQPLPDAPMFIRDRGVALTSSTGSFRFAAESAAVVTVRRIGYKSQQFIVRDTMPVVIGMTPALLGLDAVVVTSARREQRLADAVVATELLSRREIEQRGATDVSQAVRDATGVQAEAGVPSGSGVLLQGLGSRRVLILIDGQPVVGRINGNLDLSRIPTGNVERIEIVKGPQATLYGSDAMGGVINIITRRPERRGIDAELSAVVGSQGRRDVSANARAMSTDRRLLGTIDAGVRSLDLVPGRESNSDTFANRYEISPTFTWRATPRVSLDAAASAAEENQRYRLGQLYQHSDNTQFAARIGASKVTPRGKVGAVMYASSFEHLSRRSTTPLPASHDGDRDEQRLVRLDLTANQLLGGVMIDGGVDARREDARADRVQGARRILHTVEPYSQGTITLGKLSVTPGVRVSISEQWGTAFTPKTALLWRPITPLAFRAAVASGYRAPDFKELYLEFVNAPAGYAVRGNPNLRPERSANLSAGVEWMSSAVSASASGFHTRFRGFIEPQETSTPGEYTYLNIDEGRTSGAELNASVGGERATLDASYAWLRAVDVRGAPLLGRAAHTARLGATVSHPFGARLSVGSAFTSRTPTARDSAGVVVNWRASNTRVDTRIAQRIGRRLELGFAVENVLDRRADEGWPGYSGRMWSVSARIAR